MSVVVRKSSSFVVSPSEPSTTSDTTTIKLSPLDKGNFPFVVLLVYEHPIKNAADTIKRALSQALVHYYPFSGSFVPGADGDGSHIECTNREGAVQFISSSADCSWKQAAAKLFQRSSGGSGMTSSLLDELAVYYTVSSYGPTEPLLSMQLTEFVCGGFVLGVTWSHAIADGIGIAQFLGAVGELARGLPSPSIVPVRCDEAVSNLSPLQDPVRDIIMKGLAAHGNSFTKMGELLPLVLVHVTIPWSFIDRIKAEFHGQPYCTTFEVAAAVLWQCRTRATMSSPDTLSFLSIAVNVRKHVGAKDGYYGNCVIDKLVMATSSKVANMDVMSLIKMIKHSKDQVADDLLNGKKNASSRNNQLPELNGRYNLLLMSYWRNIGFEEADFGSGKPTRVMWHIPEIPPFPICVLCPNKGEDGISVISVCVKEEHADAFIGEIAKFV